jgi:hypothetical protein
VVSGVGIELLEVVAVVVVVDGGLGTGVVVTLT